MADHGIGGVDRLVGDQSGQPEQRQPEHRCHHAVGEILGAGFDCRPADAGLVKLIRDRARRSWQRLCGRRRGHPRRKPSAPRRHADRGFAARCSIEAISREHYIPHRKSLHGGLNQDTHGYRYGDHGGRAGDARQFALLLRPVFAIEPAVENSDQRSDQGHRMSQSPPEPVGIADQRVEPQRCDDDIRASLPRSAPQRSTRSSSEARRSRASDSIGPPQTVSRSGITMRFVAG